jgi:hypothetical protein
LLTELESTFTHDELMLHRAHYYFDAREFPIAEQLYEQVTCCTLP